MRADGPPRALTETYSLVHDALEWAARGKLWTPFDMRVLLALLEGGGSVRICQLDKTLRQSNEGAALRRSARRLEYFDLAVRTGAGPVVLSLTDKGQKLAIDIQKRVKEAIA